MLWGEIPDGVDYCVRWKLAGGGGLGKALREFGGRMHNCRGAEVEVAERPASMATFSGLPPASNSLSSGRIRPRRRGDVDYRAGYRVVREVAGGNAGD